MSRSGIMEVISPYGLHWWVGMANTWKQKTREKTRIPVVG